MLQPEQQFRELIKSKYCKTKSVFFDYERNRAVHKIKLKAVDIDTLAIKIIVDYVGSAIIDYLLQDS